MWVPQKRGEPSSCNEPTHAYDHLLGAARLLHASSRTSTAESLDQARVLGATFAGLAPLAASSSIEKGDLADVAAPSHAQPLGIWQGRA